MEHRQTERQIDKQKQTDYNNPLLSSSVNNKYGFVNCTLIGNVLIRGSDIRFLLQLT